MSLIVKVIAQVGRRDVSPLHAYLTVEQLVLANRSQKLLDRCLMLSRKLRCCGCHVHYPCFLVFPWALLVLYVLLLVLWTCFSESLLLFCPL